ncbi:hypothetical protein [Streptomyces carpaticus]|uniref:Uncharacterized protein n=1 Tax=Streptomyces carpaticus TaxID=285558 RepID=A0ABV4ZLT9_9ACTN
MGAEELGEPEEPGEEAPDAAEADAATEAAAVARGSREGSRGAGEGWAGAAEDGGCDRCADAAWGAAFACADPAGACGCGGGRVKSGSVGVYDSPRPEPDCPEGAPVCGGAAGAAG